MNCYEDQGLDLGHLVDEEISDCGPCQSVNSSGPNQGNSPGTRIWGQQPGANWEINYTEIKLGTYGYKYLLVFIDTFSGWVDA